MISNKKIYYDYLIVLISLYCLISLLNSLLPVSASKFISLCIMGVLLIINSRKTSTIIFFAVITFLLISGINIIRFGLGTHSVQDTVKSLNTLLILMTFTSQYRINLLKKSIISKHETIRWILISCNIVIFISALLPRCYNNGWNWGNTNNYFLGFTANSHTLASVCILLITLTLVINSGKEYQIIDYCWFIMPVYGVLFSGARTFLIPLFLIVFVIGYTKINNRLSRIIIITFLILLLTAIFFLSSMLDKFISTSKNQYATSYLDAITSGRTTFWLYDLQYYINKYSLLDKLFGTGFDFIYSLNFEQFGIRIQAHNDIINMLISVGIIGTCVYIFGLKIFLNSIRRQLHNYSNNVIMYMIMLLFIWLPLLLNGFFSYQHFVYSCLIMLIYLAL